MSLKLCSTIAVVTGKTTASLGLKSQLKTTVSLAKDDRFGKPATKSLLAKRWSLSSEAVIQIYAG